MREQGLAFDAIVASPAVRVGETLSGLIEGAGPVASPIYDRRIYNASTVRLIEVVRETNDKVDRLLIAGHNPGLQRLILQLADHDSDGLRESVAFDYPTATLAELQLSVEHWRDVDRQTGQIVSADPPRRLTVSGRARRRADRAGRPGGPHRSPAPACASGPDWTGGGAIIAGASVEAPRLAAQQLLDAANGIAVLAQQPVDLAAPDRHRRDGSIGDCRRVGAASVGGTSFPSSAGCAGRRRAPATVHRSS